MNEINFKALSGSYLIRLCLALIATRSKYGREESGTKSKATIKSLEYNIKVSSKVEVVG